MANRDAMPRRSILLALRREPNAGARFANSPSYASRTGERARAWGRFTLAGLGILFSLAALAACRVKSVPAEQDAEDTAGSVASSERTPPDAALGASASLLGSDAAALAGEDAAIEPLPPPTSLRLRAASVNEAPPTSALGRGGEYPGLPIPVRFVGMADYPSNVTEFAAGPEFEDCPRGVVLDAMGEESEQYLWGECVAEQAVAALNEELQRVLGVDDQLFESLGYFLADAPQYTVVRSRDQEEAQLAELNDFALAAGGVLTVSISNWVHRAGGYAGIDRGLDQNLGAVIMLSQGADTRVLLHEFGHIMGGVHVDADPSGSGKITSDACGLIEAPVVENCDCDFNLMQAQRGVIACPKCEAVAQTFLTPKYADYFRALADCWFSRRRFAGAPQACGFQDLQMECHGYANTELECLCPGAEAKLRLDSCTPLDASAEAVFMDVCAESACFYREAYPGVRCTTKDDKTRCICQNSGRAFSVPGGCASLTEADVFDGCLSEEPLGSCSLRSGRQRVECVVKRDTSLACICTQTGRIFSAREGAVCAELDAASVERDCQ